VSVRRGYIVGPVRRVSFKDVPLAVLADVLKMALNFVVVDDSRTTPWIGI